MLGTDALRRNRRRDLLKFLSLFCPKLDKPRQKFLHQSLWGIVMSHSLVVSRWLPWLRGQDRCKHDFYRHKRLLNQLNNRRWDHNRVLCHFQQRWAEHVDYDTPLIVDLSDLGKPRARKLKYLALVRDGSDDGRLHYGYWCLEVYAYLGHSRVVPLLLHPYSSADPAVLGENQQILEGVDQVMQSTGGKGILMMDIGADRDNLLLPWIERGYPWLVRLRGDRHLLLEDGTHIEAKLLAETLLQRSGKTRVWRKVYLPERPDRPLYLVAKLVPGHDKPLMLLTTLTAEDPATAARVLRMYRKRWKCEEAARFLKSDLGLERFAVRTYESFPRLMLLACLAMALLTWLQLHYATLRRRLCEQRPGRHAIKFIYYRLLNWLGRMLLPIPSDVIPP